MVRATQSQMQPYGVAVLAVGIAMLLMWLLNPWVAMSHSPFLMFFGAVIVSAWYGGMGVGLFATFLSALLSTYFFVSPSVWQAFELSNNLRLSLFVLEGILMSGLCETLRTTNRRIKVSVRKLRESEERYRRVLDTAYEGIWTVDAQGRINYVNHRMAQMLGYNIQNMLARPIFDFMDEEAQCEAKQYLERQQQGIKEQYDFRFRHQDGSSVWAIVSTSPICSEIGEFQGAIAMITDVSDRKQVEKALEIRLQQQAVVAQLGQRALSGIELSTLMDEVSILVTQSLDVEYCKVLELLPDGKALLLRAGVGWHPGLVGHATLGSETYSQAGYTLLSSQPVIVEDLRKETRFNGPPLLHDHQVISGMSVIIHGQNRPFGVLGVHTTRKQKFSQDDINFLQAVANVLAIAIERKRAEEAMRESQELFERFMSHSPVTAFIKDEQGRFVYVNSLLEHTWNRPLADWLGKTDFDLFPAEQAQQWRDNDTAVLAGGKAVQLLETSVDQDGVHFWLSFKFPFIDARGRRFLASMSLDISDRKRLEDELRQSEAKFRRLFEANIVGIIFPDLSGNILESNDAFLEMVGYTPEDLHAGRVRWDTMTPPEYKPLDELSIAQLRTSGVCTPFEKEYIRKDGSRVPVLMVSALLEGEQEKTVSFILDLSDRVSAKEEVVKLNQTLNRRINELETLLAVVPVGIGIAEDAQCRHIRVNPALARMLRIDPNVNASLSAPAHERPGNFKVYGNGRELTVDQLPMQYAAAHGVELLEQEVDILYDNGEITQLLEYATPLFDEQGQSRGCVGVFLDITERKQVEAKIRQLNDNLEHRVKERTAQLEAANQELESFSYSVSHDLRAPLRHISGFVDLLQKKAATTLDEKSLRYLDIITETTKQAGKLIDDLLSFSRMGRTEMRYTRVNMTLLVQEVKRDIEQDISGRNMAWQIEELPQVYGDPSMLRLVIHNLIENATKYTSKRICAEIKIGSTETEQEFVFFVRDNGVGFDMRYVHKLFGVFQRLHSPQEFEGTGIGLANVKRIIDRHSGRTWAESMVGEGATFYFSLPKLNNKM